MQILLTFTFATSKVIFCSFIEKKSLNVDSFANEN